MRSLSLFSVVLITASTSMPAEDVLDKSAVHRAVQKSVSWLEADMQAWRQDHGCAACHHGPMYLWSMNAAKQQGYSVDESKMAELTKWMLTSDEARIFPKVEKPIPSAVNNASAADRMTAAMMGHKNLSQPTIYLTHALNAMPDQVELRTLGWQKVIDHLASAQKDDGSFAGRDAWRPIFNTPQILTRFVVSGLQDAGELDTASAQAQAILKAAQSFLANQTPDESQQGIMLRILSEPKSRRDQPEGPESDNLNRIVAQLKQLQRPDGGWAQTDDRDSDAFATGQVLTALHRTGESLADPTIQRGIKFLINTQQPDGTWKMTSRPNPENGKPAEFLNPITYAATAWAAIGLTGYVPNEKP